MVCVQMMGRTRSVQRNDWILQVLLLQWVVVVVVARTSLHRLFLCITPVSTCSLLTVTLLLWSSVRNSCVCVSPRRFGWWGYGLVGGGVGTLGAAGCLAEGRVQVEMSNTHWFGNEKFMANYILAVWGEHRGGRLNVFKRKDLTL